jgi:PhzF family phenazine biosynthesis protein
MTDLKYRFGNDLHLDRVIELYAASTLGERRPIDNREIMADMLDHANLVVTAWDGDSLVGIARTLTDFSYVGYLADLAVRAPKPRISALEASQARRLSAALGLASDAGIHFLRVDVGVVWLVGDLGAAERVAGAKPNLDEVRRLSEETHSAGVTVFGQAHDGRSELHLRSFAPLLGVTEDPVCGSGNASVAAFLVHTGLIGEIGADYRARQGMEVGRDGEVAVRVENGSINFGGYAVTCVDGRLRFV